MSHRCSWDMVRRLFALVLVLVVAGCGGSSHEGHGGASRYQSPLSARSSAVASAVARPGQLHGVPLTGATGLVLLVSADPPYLLDVDTGRVTPVKGLSVHGPGPVLSVLAVGRDAVVWGRDAVVWVDRRPFASRITHEVIYLVRHGGAIATRVTAGSDVQPAAGGRSVWVGEPQHQLTLTDLRTGTRRALRWPSQIGSPDQAAVDPSAKLIAVSFSDPAYHLSGTQVTDVWLLDPSAGRWQHLPAMPADVALKFTSMSWTSDGRLVMLAQTPTSGPASHVVIAVWRPGQKSLAIRSVHIPARDSGSDSFLAWVRSST
jgi:hypothetical protein